MPLVLVAEQIHEETASLEAGGVVSMEEEEMLEVMHAVWAGARELTGPQERAKVKGTGPPSAPTKREAKRLCKQLAAVTGAKVANKLIRNRGEFTPGPAPTLQER